MKTFLFLCLLSLASCAGIVLSHSYTVKLDDGTTTTLYSDTKYVSGDKFKAFLNVDNQLLESATGEIKGTIVSSIN